MTCTKAMCLSCTRKEAGAELRTVVPVVRPIVQSHLRCHHISCCIRCIQIRPLVFLPSRLPGAGDHGVREELPADSLHPDKRDAHKADIAQLHGIPPRNRYHISNGQGVWYYIMQTSILCAFVALMARHINVCYTSYSRLLVLCRSRTSVLMSTSSTR